MTPKMQRRAEKYGSPFGRPAQPTSSEQPSVGTLSNTPELNLEEIVPVSNETSTTSESVSDKPEYTVGSKENPKVYITPFTIYNVTCCGFMDVTGIHGVIGPNQDPWPHRDYNTGKETWMRRPTPDEYFTRLHNTVEQQHQSK